ncbi:MAG: DNA polymerase III subunit delta' [Propionibacteriaceae bacterium]|jgi:DNA polymerase-3 subunit delta'|nr:DNA polymerase III subunit delta' [Propionibacteriaceae bacterium]
MAEVGTAISGVFGDLIGQDKVIAQLQRAIAGDGHAMTHAWLFTGPPGSGRSVAARAFAAALECDRGGCGECQPCRLVLSGGHPDVRLVNTETLSIKVDDIRKLVRDASLSPSMGRYQIVVIEDADRVTEEGADALLKNLEEPSPRTVWMLCAPSAEDVIVTIRSRCREVGLVTPTPRAIAELLRRRYGIDAQRAQWAARVCGGHIGRARLLAQDETVRARRAKVLQIPSSLTSLTACLTLAQEMIDAAKSEAETITKELDARELAHLRQAMGMGSGREPRNAQAAEKALKKEQGMRATRLQRDALDRALSELSVYYRDVLVTQTRAGVELINGELADEIHRFSAKTTPEATLERIAAIGKCKEAIEQNVVLLLAVKALFISLKD